MQRLWHGSRDSARTPVQWNAGENAGFTTGTPWFYVNPNYIEVNVEAQEKDEGSVLNFYRRAVALRKELSCVRHGDYKEYKKGSSKFYTYSREDDTQKILVVCSYSGKPVNWKAPSDFPMNKAELVLCNYDMTVEYMLQPYEARVYRWEKK